MILYEYEGKKILADARIKIPSGQLITSPNSHITIPTPLVLKAQTLSGKRAAAGGIVIIEALTAQSSQLTALFAKTINGEKVDKVLIEEKIDIDKEFYLSISYDTDTRGPILNISEQGGTGVEERKSQILPIDPLTRQCHSEGWFKRHPERSSEGSLDSSPPVQNDNNNSQDDLINQLINCFFDNDCLLLEINPLVETPNGWVALDAKIKLDDSASGRHPEWKYPPRSAPGHTPTKREIEAKKIDEGDYRGVAGSAFFDLPGDIAVMASGGGASLTALDTLIKNGGQPANYTEYGGNPPREKVFKLTQIVLDKPNLHGLWVVGALANFTNIYETLSGFVDGLRQAQSVLGKKIDFPIVIRRAGPHDQEARQMLASVHDFDLHLYGEETSITQSAKIMVDLAKKYGNKLS